MSKWSVSRIVNIGMNLIEVTIERMDSYYYSIGSYRARFYLRTQEYRKLKPFHVGVSIEPSLGKVIMNNATKAGYDRGAFRHSCPPSFIKFLRQRNDLNDIDSYIIEEDWYV